MGTALQLIGGIMQAQAASNQAVIAEKTAESNQLTEGYNSAQRQRDRVKEYRKQAAMNIARGGASGVDSFSGSSINVNNTSAGNLKYANYEDVFSTTNKRQQITTAGKFKAQAARNRGTMALISTAGDYAAQAARPAP